MLQVSGCETISGKQAKLASLLQAVSTQDREICRVEALSKVHFGLTLRLG